MTRRWSVATGWSLQATSDGLLVSRDSAIGNVSVPPAVAAEVVELVSGQGPSQQSISSRASRVIVGLDHRGVLAAEIVIGGEVAARHEPGLSLARSRRRRWAVPARPHSTTALRSARGSVELVGARSGDTVVLMSSWAIITAARLFDESDSLGDRVEENELLELVGRAGLLVDDDPSDIVRNWEFHDALMHGGSRFDTRLTGFGATFPRGKPAHPILVAGPTIATRIPLGTYAGERVGLSLEEALRTRASCRDHGGPPVGIAEIGALLDGALRITRRAQTETAELAWRHVPTGGALSGLSAIVIAYRAGDLPRGVYEYDAVSHDLAATAGPWPAMDRWLDLANRLTGIGSSSLQTLVLLTLDYFRPSSKYEAIVYATALKEAGAVLQTLALLSADLGLSFCPMGGGFASTDGLGSDIRNVAVVCEMAIGRADRVGHEAETA